MLKFAPLHVGETHPSAPTLHRGARPLQRGSFAANAALLPFPRKEPRKSPRRSRGGCPAIPDNFPRGRANLRSVPASGLNLPAPPPPTRDAPAAAPPRAARSPNSPCPPAHASADNLAKLAAQASHCHSSGPAVGGALGRYTFTHCRVLADSSTASRTRSLRRPSSKVGWTGLPAMTACTKSAMVCTKVCS
jgi:hypothetical protein